MPENKPKRNRSKRRIVVITDGHIHNYYTTTGKGGNPHHLALIAGVGSSAEVVVLLEKLGFKVEKFDVSQNLSSD